jgi:hypothetical protein
MDDQESIRRKDSFIRPSSLSTRKVWHRNDRRGEERTAAMAKNNLLSAVAQNLVSFFRAQIEEFMPSSGQTSSDSSGVENGKNQELLLRTEYI